MKLLFSKLIPLPLEKVRDQFNRDLFMYLAPPVIPFELVRFDGCLKNHEVHINLGFKPFTQKWISLITFEGTDHRGWSFIDEGKRLPWPLKSWKHHHRVDRISERECKIVDDITYECHPGFMTLLMKPFLWWVFSLRPSRYQKYFLG
jgi:ligand-binding SRPBCC domain-containing protein